MFSLAQNYVTRGFWGDEAWTSLISQLPYKDMLTTTAADFHPPGYYSIIELVYKFLPPTELVTRSISFLFYLLTIFMVYKLASVFSVIVSETKGLDSSATPQNDKKNNRGKEIFGLNLFGLLSAAVVALNPIFFRYAFEARNYTMFAFAATGSIFFLLEISKSGPVSSSVIASGEQSNLTTARLPLRQRRIAMTKKEVGFVLFTTLGIYTHYYMFFVLGAQGLYLILFDRKVLLKMIGLYLVTVILYLPCLPFLFGQLKSVAGDYWIGTVDKRTHYEALLRILGGEGKNLIRPWLFGISVVLLIVGLAQHALRIDPESLRLNSGQASSGQRFEKPYLLIWLWAVVPFILATLPGFKFDGVHLPFRPIFFWRYLIGSSIPLAMVMIHSAQKLRPGLFALSVAAILVLSAAVDYLTLASYPYGFKQVYTSEVVPKINSSDKIVTVLPSFAEVLYYRNRNNLSNELTVLPEGLVQFSGKSLLDAYTANGVVKISDEISGRYFELRPGPSVRTVNSNDQAPNFKQ